jgi:hypothetical protein
VRASCLLLGITILGAGATGIGTVKVEKAQVFFSKSGLSSHTLHYSNIKQDFHVKDLEEKLKTVRAAVRRRALESHFVQPLHNNETRSGHFMEDPMVYNSQKVAHRVEYRLNALLLRVSRLYELFEPLNDLIEDFALENPKETADLTFKHRHRHGRNLVQRRETLKWARIPSEWVYPLRAKRFEPITIMIAIVTAAIAALVVTIFTAVELDRLNGKQQRTDTVAKLVLMASKEISNSQQELIRLTAEVVGSLDNYYGNIDTIQHVLLVCDVADRQVGVMESAMQAAKGGHVSMAALTELNYARVALKINGDARDAGLEPVARHLSNYLQMETSFVAGKEGFNTLVHVPLIDMKSALTIWEHHILPIRLTNDLYLNLGPADYTHVAVTEDLGLYRAMTRAEFNTCRRVGKFYLCDQGLVVTKAPKLDAPPPPWRDPALCLFALFARQFELARETCQTTIGGTEAPRVWYCRTAPRTSDVHGQEPGRAGDEIIYGKRADQDHPATRVHSRDGHAHLCSG